MDPENRLPHIKQWQEFFAKFGMQTEPSRSIYLRDPEAVSSALISDALVVPINEEAKLEVHFRVEDGKFLGMDIDRD